MLKAGLTSYNTGFPFGAVSAAAILVYRERLKRARHIHRAQVARSAPARLNLRALVGKRITKARTSPHRAMAEPNIRAM